MKTSLVLFSLCLLALSVAAQQQQQASPVLDINGNQLKPGSKYYIVSAIFGAGGGGLTLSPYRSSDRLCPLTVAQEAFDVRQGIPATFHPADSSFTSEIPLARSLNVKFAQEEVPPCASAKSTVWQVGQLDPYTRERLIEIGGVEGNPSCQTENNWFKIEQGNMPGSYKFVWNPEDVCQNRRERYEVTIRSAFGNRPLVLSSNQGQGQGQGQERPFDVVFIEQGRSTQPQGYAYA